MQDSSETNEELITEISVLKERIRELEQTLSDRAREGCGATKNALNESEERYRSIFDHSSDAILLTRPDGSILDANPAACDMLGRSVEDIRSVGRAGLVDVTDPRLAHALAERARTGSKTAEITMLRANGDKFEAEVTSTIFVDAKGEQKTSMIIRDVTERKRIEEALKKRDILFRKLSSHVPGMIYQFARRPDGTYCVPFTTETIKNIFDCLSEDVREDFSPIARVILPEDLDILVRSIEASAESMTDWQCEYRVQVPGQPIRWMYGHSTPEKLTDGSIVWHGFNTDITERKQAEEAILREKLFSDAVLDSLPGIFYVLDEKHHLVRWNRNEERTTGYSTEELSRLDPLTLIAEEERDTVTVAIEEVFTEGEASIEALVLSKSGKKIPYYLTGKRAVIGGKTHLLGMGIDITERKQAELRIRESEERYRSIFENVVEGIFQVTPNGCFLTANPVLARMYGYSSPEDLIETVTDIGRQVYAHPDERREFLRIVQEKGRVTGFEVQLKRKDGSIFWASINARSVSDGKGKVLYYQGTTEDITLRKLAEEELKKAFGELQLTKDMLVQSEKLAAIGKLSAGVAHEILNPINILSLRLQLLGKTESLSEEAKETLRICRTQIDRVVRIARDLSQFSRSTTKHLTHCDLNEIIEDVLALACPRLKVEDVRTDLSLDHDLSKIWIDRFRIEQVVLNLINNAMDAMGEEQDKVLRIATGLETSEGNKVIRASFSDNGSGIKEEDIGRIFDPFFTTKEPTKGTGLGLSICYGIIHDHGGKIWAENNAGDGATFLVELPFEQNGV
jgi:PAS domain S-box-containing protein